MEIAIRKQVELVHASGTMMVVVTTGAGSVAVSWLLGVPGASRTVLEALVPYAQSSLSGFLGYEPEQDVSGETARAMARAAYRRAKSLAPKGTPVAGVACTAAIVTGRPKKGEHRCHIAWQSGRGHKAYSLGLTKGLRDREGEEQVVSRLLLRVASEAAGVEVDVPLGLAEGERVETDGEGSPVARLLAGWVDSVTFHPDGRTEADAPMEGAVLPGSFDPLHEGHERLARVAAKTLSRPVAFELSVLNVDKPPLTEAEVLGRVGQFKGKWPVVATRALKFYQKARLFPGCTFVIGWDTAVRLVDPKYYGGDEQRMVTALREIRGHGCGFLVAGRVEGGAFRTLAGIAIPDEFRGMFRGLTEREFRADISSTELRAKSKVREGVA